MDKNREKLVELIASKTCFQYSKDCMLRKKHGCSACYCGFCRLGKLVDHLIDNGVTVQEWNPASQPPKEYRDEYGELIPFLVCESGTEYPFRAMYDGTTWGDGLCTIPVTHWMPLPEPPKEE